MSQLVTPNLGAAVNIINHWYQPQIVRSVSELTLVWHFHVCPPFQSCWCLCGWSPEWREVTRSNHCSGHRYWPEESSKRRWKTFWRTCKNWEKYEKKIKAKVLRGCLTCPGKTPDTGVEPPEWLGELGRDLQEARTAACFFAVIIFCAAMNKRKEKKPKI